MKYYNLKAIWFSLFTIFLSSCISGCSTFNNDEPLLAVPQQVSFEEQVQLAQMSQQLSDTKLDNDTKIILYYQRGILYDSLGLRAYAESDFTQLLNFDVVIPEVYNYIGIYSMFENDYPAAFTALNTALELDPNLQMAYINRAIALYRNQRYEAGLVDAMKFHRYAPNDPIRSLWVYLLEEKIDKTKAKENLRINYTNLSNKNVWGSDIIAFYLGDISEKQLMINLKQGVKSNKFLAERLCETYFYLGKYYQSKGNNKRAEVLFKYALANNVYNYLEHQQALFEINQLENK